MAIRRKKIQARLEELKTTEALKLEDRQERYHIFYFLIFYRLKDLFRLDDERFRRELIAQEPTTDSRIDAMRSRVADLKAKMESKRKKVVEEKLLQRWR